VTSIQSMKQDRSSRRHVERLDGRRGDDRPGMPHVKGMCPPEIQTQLNTLAIAAAIAATVTSAAYAQEATTTGGGSPIVSQALTAIPQGAMTVTNFYKQDVYDSSDVKIGEINDVLVDKNGKLVAFVIGIGGFLGVDQKDVAVPFNSIRATWRPDLGRPDSDAALPFNASRATRREGKWWLT
jgi:sporulation protein YlmC with PRC-barrel domain